MLKILLFSGNPDALLDSCSRHPIAIESPLEERISVGSVHWIFTHQSTPIAPTICWLGYKMLAYLFHNYVCSMCSLVALFLDASAPERTPARPTIRVFKNVSSLALYIAGVLLNILLQYQYLLFPCKLHCTSSWTFVNECGGPPGIPHALTSCLYL